MICSGGECQWPAERVYSDSAGRVYRREPSVCIVDGFCWAWKLEQDRERSIEGTAVLYQTLQIMQVYEGTSHDLRLLDPEPQVQGSEEPVLDQALQLAYLQRWLLSHSVPGQGTVGGELALDGADVARHP